MMVKDSLIASLADSVVDPITSETLYLLSRKLTSHLSEGGGVKSATLFFIKKFTRGLTGYWSECITPVTANAGTTKKGEEIGLILGMGNQCQQTSEAC